MDFQGVKTWNDIRIHNDSATSSSFPEDLVLTIPERIRVTNGLSLFDKGKYSLAKDGSCILEDGAQMLDYQACSILQCSLDFASTANIFMDNIRARIAKEGGE